jgi:hypothetical protein
VRPLERYTGNGRTHESWEMGAGRSGGGGSIGGATSKERGGGPWGEGCNGG